MPELIWDGARGLAAGRNLDRLIAQQVFDFDVWVETEDAYSSVPGAYWSGDGYCVDIWCAAAKDRPDDFEVDYERDHLKPYSTDVRAAWEVVEAFIARGIPPGLTYLPLSGEWGVDLGGAATAPTMPLAVCRAALKAVTPLGATP